MVVDSHQEDAYGSESHDGSHYVETETVHRPGDPTPVILLLQITRVQGHRVKPYSCNVSTAKESTL